MNSRLVRFAVRYKLLLWSSVALGTILGGLLLFCILLNIEIQIKLLCLTSLSNVFCYTLYLTTVIDDDLKSLLVKPLWHFVDDQKFQMFQISILTQNL